MRRSGTMMLARWCVLAAGFAGVCDAQMLTGPWVQQSKQRIDEVRKTDLRVIVLGADGKPVRGAAVHIQQTRHDFDVGFILSQGDWPKAQAQAPADAPLWRCFNAVSLERLTSWPMLQPKRGAGLDNDRVQRIDEALAHTDALRMTVRWGSLISADVGRLPDWAVPLSGEDLAKAALGYRDQVVRRFGGRVDQFDVYTQSLDHDTLARQAGTALIRQLFSGVRAIEPQALACMRFDDGLSFRRAQKMQRRITAMREAFIPIDRVAINQRFGGDLVRTALKRTLDRIDQLGLPVVLSGLEVGGDGEIGAAINLEMVLRALMENENIYGVWFAGLTQEELLEPHAALLDAQGELTSAGRVVDSLFHGLWWSDIHMQAGDLGNVRVRVFPGAYDVSATLGDGSTLSARIWLDRSPETRVLLLEPIKSP